MKKLLTLLMMFMLLFVCSCSTKKAVASDVSFIQEVKEETRIESTKVADADSALIRALFECDEQNRLLMSTLDSTEGERIKPSISVTQDENGGYIVDFTCKEDSLIKEIEVRDKIINNLRQETNTIEVEVPIPLSNWESFCLVLGKIVIGLLTLIILITIIIQVCKRFILK